MMRIDARLGYRTIPEGNGVEALEAIARLVRDDGVLPILIITDLKMPRTLVRKPFTGGSLATAVKALVD